jgi:hypothetical protein
MACKYLNNNGNCTAILEMPVSKQQLEKQCQTNDFVNCFRYQFTASGAIGWPE